MSSYLVSNVDERGTDGTEWLHTVYVKVGTQLRFTLYQVENEAEVGVIFEVMNDRGKPLTELEKVKNFLLHASVSLNVPHEPNALADSVNGAWAEILRQLMAAGLESSADEDRLLRANWLTNYEPQPRRWQGSKSIKDRFALRDHREKKNRFLRYLHRYTAELREDCIAFCDAYQPTRPTAFDSFKAHPNVRLEVTEWSARLVRIGVVVPFLPLLLAARRRWPERPERYLELLKLCEAFAFRVYRIMESRTNAGQSTLFRIGHEVWKRRTSYSGMLSDVKSELARRCDDDKFKAEINTGEPEDWYNWSGLRYLLYEYEVELASKNGVSPRVTWGELHNRDLKDTIEHILPQSIDGQPYWRQRFTQERHEIYVHDLGNLTLTKHNAHYSNKPFPDKKGKTDAKNHCYARSPLYMERALMHWRHWNASAIDERRANILEWARVRWAVDLGGSVNRKNFGSSEDGASDENLENAPIDDDDT